MVRTIGLAAMACLNWGLATAPSWADQTPPQPEPGQVGASMTPGREGALDADKVHAIDVKCASVAVASVSIARKASTAGEEGADGELVQLTRARALVSGAALGMSVDQVNKDVDEGSAKILRNLMKTDGPAELKQEQLDLGRVLIECAILQTKK